VQTVQTEKTSKLQCLCPTLKGPKILKTFDRHVKV
jgi:hypothetical protein